MAGTANQRLHALEGTDCEVDSTVNLGVNGEQVLETSVSVRETDIQNRGDSKTSNHTVLSGRLHPRLHDSVKQGGGLVGDRIAAVGADQKTFVLETGLATCEAHETIRASCADVRQMSLIGGLRGSGTKETSVELSKMNREAEEEEEEEGNGRDDDEDEMERIESMQQASLQLKMNSRRVGHHSVQNLAKPHNRPADLAGPVSPAWRWPSGTPGRLDRLRKQWATLGRCSGQSTPRSLFAEAQSELNTARSSKLPGPVWPESVKVERQMKKNSQNRAHIVQLTSMPSGSVG
ncbi:unnamed protein product [Protopolystoma xenopodis]|uniref:Uncharacterized protein n=1 Tax=Protopolystoma xenopodis TaxID=117903 RepID=A0A3S5CS70_9PLAT|nr:unnamed protein product [Protopolystoma xenopodis]